MYRGSDGFWYSGLTIGKIGSMYTSDLNNGRDWSYSNGGSWKTDDKTIKFVPLSTNSCILQKSIVLASTGPTSSIRPDYLGTFNMVQGEFSAGRPVWRNSKGKVLKIRNGKTVFVVYDDLTSTKGGILSSSGPTCPTDAKAANSARYDYHAWRFWDGANKVEDQKITATSVN